MMYYNSRMDRDGMRGQGGGVRIPRMTSAGRNGPPAPPTIASTPTTSYNVNNPPPPRYVDARKFDYNQPPPAAPQLQQQQQKFFPDPRGNHGRDMYNDNHYNRFDGGGGVGVPLNNGHSYNSPPPGGMNNGYGGNQIPLPVNNGMYGGGSVGGHSGYGGNHGGGMNGNGHVGGNMDSYEPMFDNGGSNMLNDNNFSSGNTYQDDNYNPRGTSRFQNDNYGRGNGGGKGGYDMMTPSNNRNGGKGFGRSGKGGKGKGYMEPSTSPNSGGSTRSPPTKGRYTSTKGSGKNSSNKGAGKSSGKGFGKGGKKGGGKHEPGAALQRQEEAEATKRRRQPASPELQAWRDGKNLDLAGTTDAGPDILMEFAKDPDAHLAVCDALEDENIAIETRRKATDVFCNNMVVLCNDVFGHNVVRVLFESAAGSGMSPLEWKTLLIDSMKGQVFSIAVHETGCRTLQRIMECLNVDLQLKLAQDLHGRVLEAVEDQNGNHVLQKFFERMPTGKVQFIIDSFRGEVRRMATHCYGSRVLQRIIEYCDPEQVAQIYDEIHENNLSVFIHDSYGNYVIQNMVEYGRQSDRHLVFEIVNNDMATMSCHKYASNVVEKSIQQANKADRKLFVEVSLGKKVPIHEKSKVRDTKDPPIVTMMKDKYGNYVVQKLMQIAEGEERDEIVEKMKVHVELLERLPYGRHILFALREGEYGFSNGNGSSDATDTG
mmetsp:Transcript_11207/g.27396  ORF Transcript_11207/g.27396 Transcript_11207/m.27396 type:complete len:711 (-) Transcript_11207:3137-5269(-)|eukprot:CAMPEP_0179004008 /NCGR_PEP_ID=MMETSP0795-20121207/13027_1 /TAXON_ID=88552 /ORGANISM="Amoebophrya sp., Strain Ameob2" /LENGTH=710 /DNA_ID=CAMNT_0020698145 /DNA_START=1779 /DNA_END=3911 /DNA_ORIENTATION=+